METFKIKVSSKVAYFLPFFTLLLLGIKLMPQKQPSALAAVYVSIIMVIALIGPRYISRALIEFTVSENTLQLKWLKQFLFQKNRDIAFNWNDIKSYKYDQDRNFSYFKIELKDGNIIDLCHSNFFLKDDFMKFRLYFEKKILLFNQEEKKENANQKENAPKIIKQKTFFETKPGLAVSIFMLILAISIPVIITVIPHKAHVSFGLTILVSVALLLPPIASIFQYVRSNS